MRRILVLCSSEWTAARANAGTDYMHEVGVRMAREGHFVAWLCSNERHGFCFTESRPSVEAQEGIQVARLGPHFLYGRMVRLVLSQLRKKGKLSKLYDVIVSCVAGRPLDLGDQVDVPVLPIVFNLAPNVLGTSEPPGPLVATSEDAHRALVSAGFPERSIVRAPFGATVPESEWLEGKQVSEDNRDGKERQSILLAMTDHPAVVLQAVDRMEPGLRPSYVEFVGRKRVRNRGANVRWRRRVGTEERSTLFETVRFGYCGSGYEYEALSVGGAGIATVCAMTSRGAEYFVDGESGLSCQPGNPRELAEALTRLAKDEVLRKRLAMNARKRAEAQTWDQTASRVMSAVEAL